MFKIDICGTGGAMPLPNRRLSAFNLSYLGRNILFDCGEACQISLRELHSGFKNIDIICISHKHGDHLFGLPGLLLTMANSNRLSDLLIIAPFNMSDDIRSLINLCYLPFNIYLLTTRAKSKQKLYFSIDNSGTRLLAISNPPYSSPINSLPKINSESSETLHRTINKNFEELIDDETNNNSEMQNSKRPYIRIEKVYEAKGPILQGNIAESLLDTADTIDTDDTAETLDSNIASNSSSISPADNSFCDFTSYKLLDDDLEIAEWEKNYPYSNKYSRPLASAEATANLIISFSLQNHRCPCLAFRLDFLRRPLFDKDLATKANIDKSKWSVLQRGEAVDGISPSEVMSEPRPGFTLAYVTDSRPVLSNKSFLKQADLLISEATFAKDEDLAKAKFHKHMTFREAAKQAREAEVKQLILTHFSASLKNPDEYLHLAKEEFDNVICASDLDEFNFKFPG